MKILYVHQHFSTPQGAVGTRSYELARRMVEAGHEVTVVCGSFANAQTGLVGPFHRGKRTGIVDGIEVNEFSVSVGNKLGLLARTKAFLSFSLRSLGPVLKSDYDLIFATSTPLTVAISGIVAKIARGKKFVFEVRDLWPELPKAMGVITNPAILGAMSMLEWLAYRCCDAGVGLSPGIVDGIKKRSAKNKPVLLAPNACDVEIFSSSVSENSTRQLSIPGVTKDDYVAVFTGTHGKANGLDNVLNGAKELLRRNDDDAKRIKLVFIGDGQCKDALLERKRKEKLDNCLFLDPVPKPQLAQYLQRADAGIMALENVPAFYYGTSPNKFFDYLAASLPVICNYPGWVSEMIVENHCGISVKPLDPDAFAEGMIALSKMDKKTLKANALALGKRDFSREAIASRLILFLEKIAAGQSVMGDKGVTV